jgi:phosphoribosylamine--glycine ligase
MKVLIVGSGGREHALAQHVISTEHGVKLLCAPGNPGTAELAKNVPVRAEDVPGLVRLAREQEVDLTLVGPEDPLCAGIVDAFEAEQMKIFGPCAAAARLEGDKAYAKTLMRQAAIPTADARIFEHFDRAQDYISSREHALVVKAAGLARGKGVVVCEEPSEALRVAERMMVDGIFGDAGARIVVEERLRGPEVSVHALIDEHGIVVLETSQDHKPVGDGNVGANTGGMGACSPAAPMTSAMLDDVVSQVLIPIVSAMHREGTPYRGVLYTGLMLTAAGPKVLEFNCRFGDPETQVLLPRLKTSLVQLALAACAGRLDEVELEWDPRPAVSVVMASSGYPGEYRKGDVITGIPSAASQEDTFVFHAGTMPRGDKLVTVGGRVLAVTAMDHTLQDARERAYAGVDQIRFEGAHYRSDIGAMA